MAMCWRLYQGALQGKLLRLEAKHVQTIIMLMVQL